MTYYFPNLEPVHVPCPVLTVASCLHTYFSGGRSGGLVFPSLEEFSTVCCDPHIEKARECQKNIYFCFTEYTKAFDCVDHNKVWNILQEMGIPDHPTCLLRNMYAGQETTVGTRHGTTDWFQIGKGVCQGCILSPCLFNIYKEYIMQNDGLDEAQPGIKFVGRNINNLRYSDDTTLMAERQKN